MVEAYLKQLIQNGEGKFHVIRIAAEGQEALNVKRDVYLADDWQDATKEEYDAQMNSASTEQPNVQSEPVNAEQPAPAPETAPEAPAEEPKQEEAQPQPENAPEASPEAPAAPEGEAPAPEPES
jgi:glucan-binding YG repeat protein